MALTRRTDWAERLADFLDVRREVPYSPGTNDCCMFAADAVLAMTDTDLAAEHRGKYDTEEAMAERLHALGGLVEIARAAGLEACEPEQARRGDVVVARYNHVSALGVIDGTGAAIAFPSANGVAYLPLKFAVLGFRVG